MDLLQSASKSSINIVHMLSKANSHPDSLTTYTMMIHPETISMLSSLSQYKLLGYIDEYRNLGRYLNNYQNVPIHESLKSVVSFQRIEAGLHYAVANGVSEIKVNQNRDGIENIVPDWFLKSKTFKDAINIFTKGSLEKLFVYRYLLYTNGISERSSYCTPPELGVYIRSRNKQTPKNEILEWQLETIQRSIDLTAPLEKDLVLWRGISQKESYLSLKNEVIISLTHDIHTAVSSMENPGVLLHITVKAGSRVLPIWAIESKGANDWEILIKTPIMIKKIETKDIPLNQNVGCSKTIYLEIATSPQYNFEGFPIVWTGSRLLA